MARGGQNGPVVVVRPEQLVGDALHMDQVVMVGADAAQDPEDGLDEEGRLHHPAIDEMGKIVEMAHIVALELEAGAAALSEFLEQPLHVLEGVSEDEVARVLEVRPLPRMLELGHFFQDGEQAKIH
jgi:hypothetical protein